MTAVGGDTAGTATAATGDGWAAAMSLLPLVAWIATRFRGYYHVLGPDDLIHEGLLAARGAAATFRDGEAQWPSYAGLAARRAMLAALDASRYPVRVPRHAVRAIRSLRGGECPARLAAVARPVVRFLEDDTTARGHSWPDLDPPELDVLLGRLGDRDRRIVSRRFGLGGGPAMTSGRVGAEFGISGARVRQIESAALEKMRRPEDAPWH